MPSTVNGCGTHYYGKSNVKLRNGTCRRCHRQTSLASYDTRLFIVIVFIPVWPLGRKRIIDSCSQCTGHYVIPARQWEVGGQLNISDAMTRFTNEPSADSAARAHGQLLSYFQYDEARALREKALALFPEDGALRADLGWQMHALDQHAEAAALFNEAVQMRPDLPSARSGKAQYLMGQGRLDEAHELLEFLTEPGAGQLYDLRPLLVLFEQFHLARRHDDALALVPHIMQELPAIKDDFWFRKVVSKAERAAGRLQSLLPERNRSWFNLLFSTSRDYSPRARNSARLAILAAGVIGALGLHNESIRRSRTVYVVNQTGIPAQLSFDGQPPVTVAQQTPFTVSEGKHRARISGPVEGVEELVVSSGYFERWFRRPMWIINVNGEAVLEESDIIYAVNPPPSNPRFRLGETVLAFPNVDYLFDEQPPQSIQVKGNQIVVKHRVQVLPYPPETVVSSLIDGNTNGALTVAEKVLARRPSADLLEMYSTAAKSHGARERAARFLETGLDRRPFDVRWHRTYQDLQDTPGTAVEVLSRYEKLTQSEPGSATAWYLFARNDPDLTRSGRSIDKALELDPRFGWALYLRSSRALNRAEWDQANLGLKAALAAAEHDESWRMVLIMSLLAQEKYDEVDDECSRIVTSSRFAWNIPLVRYWSQYKRNLPVDTGALIAAAANNYPPQVILTARASFEAMLAYAAGNWDELRTLYRKPQLADIPAQQKALQLLSTMSLADLKSQFPRPTVVAEGDDLLAVALAFELAGDHDTTTVWVRQAIDRLQQGGRGDRQVAAALAGDNPPSVADIRNISLTALHQRSLVCAALARQFPDRREPLLAEARLWQLLPTKHYWIVDEAVRRLGEPAP
jgi:tetratricopeptide (TPR) repeat protein